MHVKVWIKSDLKVLIVLIWVLEKRTQPFSNQPQSVDIKTKLCNMPADRIIKLNIILQHQWNKVVIS